MSAPVVTSASASFLILPLLVGTPPSYGERAVRATGVGIRGRVGVGRAIASPSMDFTFHLVIPDPSGTQVLLVLEDSR